MLLAPPASPRCNSITSLITQNCATQCITHIPVSSGFMPIVTRKTSLLLLNTLHNVSVSCGAFPHHYTLHLNSFGLEFSYPTAEHVTAYLRTAVTASEHRHTIAALTHSTAASR
jgi:hypothetical protein